MAGSFSSVYLHIVFSTYGREPTLTAGQSEAIFAYMAGILRNLGCTSVLVNGHRNHVHILCTLPVTLTVADLVAKLKGNSSRWISQSVEDCADFRWQNGYAVFSFSRKQLAAVQSYIRNQHQHHRTKTFEEEYRSFLDAAAVEYTDQYLFG